MLVSTFLVLTGWCPSASTQSLPVASDQLTHSQRECQQSTTSSHLKRQFPPARDTPRQSLRPRPRPSSLSLTTRPSTLSAICPPSVLTLNLSDTRQYKLFLSISSPTPCCASQKFIPFSPHIPAISLSITPPPSPSHYFHISNIPSPA